MVTEIPTAATASYRQELGDGLVLRWSTSDDAENLARLCGMAFRNKEDDPSDEWMELAVHQLMSGKHPLMGTNDYGLVEDTNKKDNPIVACVCLLYYTWQYQGISFPVGRPEIVATNPDYRNRGLIRKIFAMVHARSATSGHLMQAITGIPYFYRQFGYEYALELGGKRVVYTSLIPKLKEGETEPYYLRTATSEDIPHLMECYDHQHANSMMLALQPESYHQYRLNEWQMHSIKQGISPCQVFVDSKTNQVLGYATLGEKRSSASYYLWSLNFAPHTNIQALAPSLLRGIAAHGEKVPQTRKDIEPLSEIHFELGSQHPFYDVLGALAPKSEQPYAWYIRVPDLPAFLKKITPVLEQRLADSPLFGYSGELKLHFYRDGVRLAFEKGRVTTIESWRPPIYEPDTSAAYPPLVFLQQLTGYRSLQQLRSAFPDVWATDEAALLLTILFPARFSSVSPLF